MSVRSSGFAVILVLLVAGLVPVAGAQEERLLGDVSIQVEASWPNAIGKGYVPVFVTLTNEGGRNRTVDLDLRAWGSWRIEKAAKRMVSLAPGESTQIEMLAPSFLGISGSNNNNFSLTALVAGESYNFSLPSGSESWSSSKQNLLVVTPGKPDDVLRARLQSELAVGRAPRVTDPEPTFFRANSARIDLSVSVVRGDSLPRGFQGYTSLNVVLVDTRQGLPELEALAPLLTWVRLGGSAVVVGPDALEELGRISALEGAFEERFRRIELPGGGLYQLALGRLYVLGGSGSEALVGSGREMTQAAVRDALLESSAKRGSAASWVPSKYGRWRLEHTPQPSIPGLDNLPLRAFMVLLVLFAVLIGPVNLVFLKRIGRPVLLLVTIPLLSAAASVGLLLYGIFYQGLDTKAARRTLTVLDQRIARSDTVERRKLFVGLSPGRGLRPRAATAVIPENVDGDDWRFIVDFEGGALLRGDFLPVRSETTQIVLSESACRVHLVAHRDGTGVQVINNLDQRVKALVLRDPQGGWYLLSGVLDVGERARLEPFDPLQSEEEQGPVRMVTGGAPMYQGLELAPGCYLASLADSAFSDDCGLDLTVQAATHVVLGILPLDERSWKH